MFLDLFKIVCMYFATVITCGDNIGKLGVKISQRDLDMIETLCYPSLVDNEYSHLYCSYCSLAVFITTAQTVDVSPDQPHG
jgi:hypothetical protein